MHFSPETALNLIERTTSEAERRFWDKHIESCSECVVELCEWSTLVGWVTRMHLVSAPEDVLALAKEIVKAPPKTPQFPDSVRQIAASLVFDSFAQPLGIGAREDVSLAQATSRELVLQAEEFDIYLKITFFKEHRELLGQILPRGSNTFVNDATLHLRQNDERVGSANVNDLGEFQFSNFPDGLLSLQIDLPNLTIITTLNTTM